MLEANTPNVSASAPNSSANFVKYLEPATILTISIGAVYYLGWLHVDSYLRRIGINHLSLNLPTTYYLKQGYFAVSAGLVFINIFAWHRQPAPKDRVEAAAANMLVLTIVGMVLLPDLGASRQLYYFSLITIGAIVGVLVVLTWRKESVIHVVLQHGLVIRFLFVLMLFGVLSIYSTNAGDAAGKNAIEGTSSVTSGITFVWNTEAPSDIEGKQLILILHHEDKYYVVEKAAPAPAYPRVYIVPDEMVKYASTTTSQ